MAAVAAFREGWQFDHDEIRIREDGLLGRGGSGDVYRGTYLTSEVAVKVIRTPASAKSQGAVDGFVREVAIMTKLHQCVGRGTVAVRSLRGSTAHALLPSVQTL